MDPRPKDRAVLAALLPAASSPISTGTSRRWRRPCTTCCGSGCDRGVDGFRMDVVHKIGKDPELGDNEPGRRHDEDWPSVHERLRDIRRVLDEYDRDRMAVGEVYVLDQRALARYVSGGDGLHLVHNFVFLNLPWSAAAFRATVDQFEELAGPKAWPAWCLGNHDHSRIATRYGPAPARVAAMLLLTPPRHAVPVSGRRAGPPGRRGSSPTGSSTSTGATPCAHPSRGSRPRRRAPVRDSQPARPGCPSPPTPSRWRRRCSLVTPHRCSRCTARCLTLRRATPALREGDYRPLDAGDDVFAYVRGGSIAVALNFADEPRPAGAPAAAAGCCSPPARQRPPVRTSTSPRSSSQPTRA